MIQMTQDTRNALNGAVRSQVGASEGRLAWVRTINQKVSNSFATLAFGFQPCTNSFHMCTANGSH